MCDLGIGGGGADRFVRMRNLNFQIFFKDSHQRRPLEVFFIQVLPYFQGKDVNGERVWLFVNVAGAFDSYSFLVFVVEH